MANGGRSNAMLFILHSLWGQDSSSYFCYFSLKQIQETTYTRLCNKTKNILTVNGSYPGPTISARKGDTVYVKVINRGNKNITIHWHGINQPRDPWSDGPEYITQCPIQPRANYTQRIQFTEEEGTLWWHAHSEYDRATVHGAIVIYPKLGTTFPFHKPHKEFTLILGEWWNENITDVYQSVIHAYGSHFKLSDANTINGQPGDFMPCSSNDAYYNSIAGVYTTDFPDQPPNFFNFTDATNEENLAYVDKSTKVKVLEYNSIVEIVFQGTNLVNGQVTHPIHLHGHRFYAIGRGTGNFDNKIDPLSYNLVDPPHQNTLGVPKNGWATIRFRAANPGVWFMHCHLETHTIWGMDVVFITKNGNSAEAKILPPPADKPPC
ncbi:laccase-15-like protein [Carex littledalei]|uniref:Laccase-15-like protein n=1 Tax=Carex littledalei TaxID=544730 RepID=A0A833R936_9POAL|nr:laccase-15-like protein [Carex littledalei]